ncbi:MAG: hypothetical protein J0M12_17260, partial [Deltaproteobacteria bacterium]|nr:hypothetical protein [Deltaproteobacteria bacterium]
MRLAEERRMNAKKTIVYAALLAATVMLAAAPTASADVVLKDHVSNSSLWNNVGGYANFDFSGSNNTDTIAATCFTSNGGTLTSISGIFYKAANGNPNGGTWSAFDFRFVFYNSVSSFQSDPFGGSYSHVFGQPSNANWLTPVGTWG